MGGRYTPYTNLWCFLTAYTYLISHNKTAYTGIYRPRRLVSSVYPPLFLAIHHCASEAHIALSVSIVKGRFLNYAWKYWTVLQNESYATLTYYYWWWHRLPSRSLDSDQTYWELTFACFSFFFYMFIFLVTCANHNVSFSVHVKLPVYCIIFVSTLIACYLQLCLAYRSDQFHQKSYSVQFTIMKISLWYFLYLNIVECQNYLKTPANGVICSTNASRFLLFWTENRSNCFHLSDKLQMTSELVTT